MSNKKESSVEWLKDQLEYFGNKHELTVSWDTIDYLIEQAKTMHKDEIEVAYKDGQTISNFYEGAQDYYTKTFGGNNE